MGAYQIWYIEFENKKSRDLFEKIRKVKRLFQYKDDTYDCTYYIGWEGYAEGFEFLEKHKKKLKIKKFLSLDLSCQSSWYNELKNHLREEEENAH